MNVAEFDYDLPEHLIAQTPAERRDRSRLMMVHRADGRIEGRVFAEVVEYLRPGDVLVLNNTRVIPARLVGHREEGGSVELLLLKRLEGDPDGSLATWTALARPGRRARPGARVFFRDPERPLMVGTVIEANPDGTRTVRFECAEPFEACLRAWGQVPLPPYIRRERPHPEDAKRYQTVYAAVDGAVAAPTAGLHFTEDLLSALQGRGVETAFVTLHVGWGTFAPLRVERVEEHRIHAEAFEIGPEAAEAIHRARVRGGRVVAVGTTSVRVLETAADGVGQIAPRSGATDLFIYPGYRFKAVDALITNFHLPRSTLLMLVSAFAGRELILRAYQEAIQKGYRFYSYGDAMLIL